MNISLVFMNDTQVVGRGAGYIAGAILSAGHKVAFYDSFYDPIESITGEIVSGFSDIVMISTMTMNFPSAISLIRGIKKTKNIPIVMGGIHPTIEGARLLEQYPEIDYLCIGEGESMVIDFLRHFSTDALFDVHNLCYRKNGKVFCNPIRPAEDLASLPSFPWHFFRKESIGDGGKGFLYVTASRGCPYNCTYCCNGIYLKLYGKNYIRFRPIDSIIEELLYLKSAYAPRLFYFGDEMILADPDYAKKLFSKVNTMVGIPYGLMARVEYITPELAAHLKETGCQYVAMGIECGDEGFRREYLNRNHSNRQIEQAFSLLKDVGIFRASFNIVGYPFNYDNKLTNTTILLNKKVKPDYAYFTILYPFPGTKLYERCIELDLIDSERMKKTRQYYEESVLKNVFLKKKCTSISRRFNSVIPFEIIFDIKTSGKGHFLEWLMKINFIIGYFFRKAVRLLLGKKIISLIKSLRNKSK